MKGGKDQDNQGQGGGNGRFARTGEGKPGNEQENGNWTGDDDNEHKKGNDEGQSLDGSGGNDNINARGGDDTVYGGTGEDNITGGPGDDDLWGGDSGGSGDGETDIFNHSGDVTEDGCDTIHDYEVSDFSGSTVNAIGDIMSVDVMSFDNGITSGGAVNDATDLADYLYVDADGDLIADLDGAGGNDGSAIFKTGQSGNSGGHTVEINDQLFVWDGSDWIEVI